MAFPPVALLLAGDLLSNRAFPGQGEAAGGRAVVDSPAPEPTIMPHPDATIYAFHALYWASFVSRLYGPRPPREDAVGGATAAGPAGPATNDAPRTAPFSRAVFLPHMLGMTFVYLGIREAVFRREPLHPWFPHSRIVAAATICLGAAVVVWTLLVFRSWRFRARIDPGHELCTEGPFALLRNPIYLSMDLLALGSAIWLPTPFTVAGLAFVIAGGELRARVEEKVLAEAFGSRYREYRARVKRFIPGVY
ncbi:MAG TPA: isoprenylcysteine carboxylmethyltransferase family protein [Planctomycetota bacterium]|nr:isoprenylcysteine carboxylmethyltransferase family protein [Planctomycetota bacterium]